MAYTKIGEIVVENANPEPPYIEITHTVGTLSHDVTGKYHLNGTHDTNIGFSQYAFEKDGGGWWIWQSSDLSVWVLSPAKGDTSSPRWNSTLPTDGNPFSHAGGSTGTITGALVGELPKVTITGTPNPDCTGEYTNVLESLERHPAFMQTCFTMRKGEHLFQLYAQPALVDTWRWVLRRSDNANIFWRRSVTTGVLTYEMSAGEYTAHTPASGDVVAEISELIAGQSDIWSATLGVAENAESIPGVVYGDPCANLPNEDTPKYLDLTISGIIGLSGTIPNDETGVPTIWTSIGDWNGSWLLTQDAEKACVWESEDITGLVYTEQSVGKGFIFGAFQTTYTASLQKIKVQRDNSSMSVSCTFAWTYSAEYELEEDWDDSGVIETDVNSSGFTPYNEGVAFEEEKVWATRGGKLGNGPVFREIGEAYGYPAVVGQNYTVECQIHTTPIVIPDTWSATLGVAEGEKVTLKITPSDGSTPGQEFEFTGGTQTHTKNDFPTAGTYNVFADATDDTALYSFESPNSLWTGSFGLNRFSMLETLDVSDNALTDVDISENDELTYLDVSDNEIIGVNLDYIAFRLYLLGNDDGEFLDVSGQSVTVSNTGGSDLIYLRDLIGWDSVTFDEPANFVIQIRTVDEWLNMPNTSAYDHAFANDIDCAEYGTFFDTPFDDAIAGSLNGMGFTCRNLTIEHNSEEETISTLFGGGIGTLTNIRFRFYQNTITGGIAGMICGIAPTMPLVCENVTLEDCTFTGGVPIYAFSEDFPFDVNSSVDNITFNRVACNRSDFGEDAEGQVALLCNDLAGTLGTVTARDCRINVADADAYGICHTISGTVGKIDITGLQIRVVGYEGDVNSDVAGVCNTLGIYIPDIKVYGSIKHAGKSENIAGVAIKQLYTSSITQLDLNVLISASNTNNSKIGVVFTECTLNETKPSIHNAWVRAFVNAPSYDIGGICHTITTSESADFVAFSQVQLDVELIGATVSGIATNFLDTSGNYKKFSDIVIAGKLTGGKSVSGLFAKSNEFTLSAVAQLAVLDGTAEEKNAMVVLANENIKIDPATNVVWVSELAPLGEDSTGDFAAETGISPPPVLQITEEESKLRSSYVGWDFVNTLVQQGLFSIPSAYVGLAGITKYNKNEQYFRNTIVYDTIGGVNEYFVALRDVNTSPLGGTYQLPTPPSFTDTTNWRYIENGSWDGATTYLGARFYIFGGDVYYCRAQNTNQSLTNTTFWENVSVYSPSRRAYARNERFATVDGRYFITLIRIGLHSQITWSNVFLEDTAQEASGTWQMHNTFTIPYLRLWSVVVPLLQTYTPVVADALIASNNLNKGLVHYVYDSSDTDTVLSQSITAGTIVPLYTYLGYTLAVNRQPDPEPRLPDETFFAPRTNREMRTFVADHLPQGRLFASAFMADSNMNRLMGVLGAPLLEAERRLPEFITDYNISTSTSLLRAWEESVLLPNEITKEIRDTAARRSFVKTRFSKRKKQDLSEVQAYIRDATGFNTLFLNHGISDISEWNRFFTLTVDVAEEELGSNVITVDKNSAMLTQLLREVLPSNVAFLVQQPSREAVVGAEITDRTNHTITVVWGDPVPEPSSDALSYISLKIVGDEVGKQFVFDTFVGAGTKTFTFTNLQNATNYTVELIPYYDSGFFGDPVVITHTGVGTTTTNVLSKTESKTESLMLDIPSTNTRNYCRLV